MNGPRRYPWPAVLVSAVAALVVSPLVVSPLLTPAWAERFTGQPQTSTPPAGAVDGVEVTGPARLDSPSMITASVTATVPGRTRGEVVLTVSGQTCTAEQSLPIGRSTLTVSCAITPRANQVPSLPATVEVRLDRVVDGRRALTHRTVNRSVAMDDGDPVPLAEASRRWRELTAALHAEAGGMVVA